VRDTLAPLPILYKKTKLPATIQKNKSIKLYEHQPAKTSPLTNGWHATPTQYDGLPFSSLLTNA